ncbi:hypothetical protein OH76DRAFT_471304 [Lentinus brumalis]|uniref:Methyltransferase n=1 Tax=Lentinus brumalis TaxID=2498619 RepID=A0A371DCU3_9APHY|nr:hypothetical protein OH76DRAFT_471304 [Polyporus brumalis]
MTVDVLPPSPAPGQHDVSATLNYHAPLGDPTEEAYRYIYLTPPPGKPEHNLGEDQRPVVVHDARGREDEFSLDKNGFQFVRHASAEAEFVDEERIKEVYYKEAEELLKSVTGAKRVLIFDHTIRRHAGKDGSIPRTEGRGPVERVHIDQTYEASIKRVNQLLGADAPRLLGTRIRLINLWRPIANPVYHRPLALGDWRTLDPTHDLVPVTYYYPDRTGATFSVRWNPAHQWWYLSEQRPDEVTLIKCFDSREEDGCARLTPHSAFWDRTTPQDKPSRQSIELRALLFDEE